ncbi:TIR domain-containing protein [Arenimonas sp.]|uniref:TIR domain-containing protein n=1 Tax=Arenimonas sp. TaxID=1872635 RepID=UPI0035B0C81F
MTSPRRYRAFISYSHVDTEAARWLQRALERYRPPAALRASRPDLPARLYPVFRDQDELASAHDLSDSIRQAMDDSDAMVVVCSPAAAASRWVNEEIRYFRASGRGYRILCYLVAGDPDPASPQCGFPPALLRGDDGTLLHEPLAADATAAGDGRRNAMLRIAAGLLDVGVDELKRRDAQRQARTWAAVATASLAVAAVTVGLALYAFKSQQESELRRQQAEALIGFMLGDLRQKLEPIGRLELLDSVGDETMAYFATLGERGTASELLARAVALKQIGDVRFKQGKLEAALASFEQALAQARQLHETEPANNDYLFELGQAEFWVGYVAWERGQLARADTAMHNYLRHSLALHHREPGNSDYNLELAYAYSNLGSLSRARGDAKTALAYFGLCRDITERELARKPGDSALTIALAETWSWIGSTRVDDGDLAGGELAFAEVTRLLQPLHERGDDVHASDLLGRNLIFHANSLMELGRTEPAVDPLEKGVAIFSRLSARDPQNASWSRSAQRARLARLGLTAPALWTPEQARTVGELVQGLQRLAAQDPSNAGAVVDLSHGLRLQALQALAAGDPGAARAAASEAHRRMSALVAGTDYSAQRLAELARVAEVLGTAQAASGEHGTARATWSEAAERLDRQARRTFEFLPVRRLLAINLGQSGQLVALQEGLDQAGYQDPRMEPAYTLTGAFQPD